MLAHRMPQNKNPEKIFSFENIENNFCDDLVLYMESEI